MVLPAAPEMAVLRVYFCNTVVNCNLSALS